MNTPNPNKDTAKVFFVIFAFFMAMYLLLVHHMHHVHAQSNMDAGVPVDASLQDVSGTNAEDPFILLDMQDAIQADPLVGLVDAGTVQNTIDYHFAIDNPHYNPNYDFNWRAHNDYEYFVWLEASQKVSKKQIEEVELQKILLQREITTAVMYNLVHCVRSLDNVGVINPTCQSDPHGCVERVNAIVGYIVDVSFELNLDPWLMAAVALHESSFNPFAVSEIGAVGVFQINPNIPLGRGLKFVRSKRYRNACKNRLGNCQKEIVEAAAVHLYKDIRHCQNNIRRALTRYNTGRCTINGHIRQSYVKTVFRNKARLLKVKPPVPWCDPNRSGKTEEYFL